jgi:LemA protein
MSVEIWIGAGVVVLGVIVYGTYNGLITKRNRVQDALAQIDVQLKRRYDLIPNLVETVKGYMKYVRSSIVTGSMQDKATANNKLSHALKSIFAVAENYPDLKASETYKNLEDELSNTENKISFVRTSYNDYVLDYNTAIQQFPGNIFSNMFNFKTMDFFKAPDEASEPVKVDLTSDDAGSAPKKASPKSKK